MRVSVGLLILSSCLLCAACGQQGALILPEPDTSEKNDIDPSMNDVEENPQ